MTLRELLAMLRGPILNDRSDRLTSSSSDYLWEDETLITYINEAQRKFAVGGLVLRDGSSDAATKVTLVEGQTTYTLHASVIGVISAKREDQTADLARIGHSLLGGQRQSAESWVDPATFSTLPAGVPLAYSTDEELRADDEGSFGVLTLRVYPAPSADQDGDVVRLRVVRKPIEPLVIGDLSAVPEIPEDHHIEMLDWAAYLALRIVDQEAGAPKRAAEFKATFEQNVVKARAMAMRKLFAPTPWGFGRGGFSWSN